MVVNLVQFQPGLSMSEFFERYGTDEKREAALFASRSPSGCRHWRCSAHRHQSTLKSGSAFEASKLPLTTWFQATHLLTQAKNNLSTLQLMRNLGVCYQTAWLLEHEPLEVMRLREEGLQITGRVAIGGAHLGGERWGGKRALGAENTVSFVGGRADR